MENSTARAPLWTATKAFPKNPGPRGHSLDISNGLETAVRRFTTFFFWIKRPLLGRRHSRKPNCISLLPAMSKAWAQGGWAGPSGQGPLPKPQDHASTGDSPH